MPVLPINYDNLEATSKTFDTSKPVYLLNLWKYKEKAEYLPEHAKFAGQPCSGREACDRYIEAIRPVMPPDSAPFFACTPIADVVVPKGEKWDYVVLVRYSTFDGFRNMVESKKYIEEVQPHRLAGLDDMRLIMLDKIEL